MGFFTESIAIELLYASLLIFWIIYLYFVKDYGYWEERHITHIPAVFPFGSIKTQVLASCYVGTTFDQLYKEFKDERFVGFIDVRRPALLIRDPELVRLILHKGFHSFTDHFGQSAHPKEYLLNHLFSMKGQEWKDMRLKLNPAYTAAKMKMMFFLIKKCSDILREVVEKFTEKNSVVDVKDLLSRFTIDVISTCAFGIEINSLADKNSEFYRLAMKCMEIDPILLFKSFIFNSFPIFQKYYCFNLMDPTITKFFSGVIRSTVEYREKHNISRYDFLDLLIKLRQNQSILEEGEKPADHQDISSSGKRIGLTFEEIAAETFLFFNAGYETTSNTIMFCLYELACNDKIQNKLHMEVEEVLTRHETITYEALQEMTYMDQVINETLRHYPPFSFLMRCCTQDFRIPNSTLTIKQGQHIIIPISALQHDPKYFPDPSTFNPERFSPDNVKKLHPYVYLPFGKGPRMCIGRRFGLMNVKTALASLVLDFQFSLTPDTDVPLQFKSNSLITVPSKPLMLIFTGRKTKI